MDTIAARLGRLDWEAAAASLHGHGYAILPGVLKDAECADLQADYTTAGHYRKTITMERYRFGAGEYKYYRYPLPDILQQLRTHIYPQLAPVANTWMQVLEQETRYPAELAEWQARCAAAGQTQPTVLILQYGKGGYNTLHQDLYGDLFFPIQAVLFLNDPEEAYSGGEFVLLEQRPRAQSRAYVLRPGKGDLLLFTTNFRPVKGSRGYYRVNMKHGVSEVQEGRRYTVGIIFHDAV
ncbi:2OG-Fe(II) oxygenase [Chitinophaga pendula]|uniref:2OG-Fe(II) oxygenase n=1 Tax=Chitinophaga TaxID=79328 RepID=UPI000BB0CA4D|nr:MULTISPECIES: 2OG-Fe(II) oxygenase [Chitinophaga]ASZ12356.1 prolyl 4-hydroxylase subunit alpha [Chitinophaga sp. MD30]UCJ10050.1 2OG-Fe(II) oxygenase [Chitinophaga pendula]